MGIHKGTNNRATLLQQDVDNGILLREECKVQQ
jgi:hypothetical protein